jgi:hypothetical protein
MKRLRDRPFGTMLVTSEKILESDDDSELSEKTVELTDTEVELYKLSKVTDYDELKRTVEEFGGDILFLPIKRFIGVDEDTDVANYETILPEYAIASAANTQMTIRLIKESMHMHNVMKDPTGCYSCLRTKKRFDVLLHTVCSQRDTYRYSLYWCNNCNHWYCGSCSTNANPEEWGLTVKNEKANRWNKYVAPRDNRIGPADFQHACPCSSTYFSPARNSFRHHHDGSKDWCKNCLCLYEDPDIAQSRIRSKCLLCYSLNHTGRLYPVDRIAELV